MTTRQDQLLASLAAQLRLAIVRPLAGGNFGACLVRNDTGELSVLKALPSARFAAGWQLGSTLCNLLHASAYPAPQYRAVGVHEDCTWSLQTFADGEILRSPTLDLALALATLAQRHRDRAPHEADFFGNRSREFAWLQMVLAGDPRGAALLARLQPLLANAPRLAMRRCDIVHGDFHALNVLQIEGRVSCVIDWEGAAIGDWRIVSAR